MATRKIVRTALGSIAVIGVTATLVAGPSAHAEPLFPTPPDPVTPAMTSDGVMDVPAPGNALPAPFSTPNPLTAQASVGPGGSAAGQDPTPFADARVFSPPTFNPLDGSMVGVAKPISINFQRPIADRPMAEQAIHISSNPPVPGKFYWMSDTQVRWRPIDFWPANTTVTIDASGTRSSFRTGESLVATIDDATHQMTVARNGVVEKTFPVSLGKSKYETKNGTYYVLEKFADIVMDSSTYGVPVDAPEGYKLKVQDAVRIDNSGIFVHSAPWSVGDQGKRNVSHGCINLSPANAQWFYDNFGSGDPVVIKNTTGGIYNQSDGAQDWQI